MKGDNEEEADELSIGTFNKACIDCFQQQLSSVSYLHSTLEGNGLQRQYSTIM